MPLEHGQHSDMYYGKGNVFVYRTYATPLQNIAQIPESTFTGRDNILWCANVKIAVYGEEFLPSFTEGDNHMIVATDSMKNFILRHAGIYDGSTLEGFLVFVSKRLMETYPHMTKIDISAQEIPFQATSITNNKTNEASQLVFQRFANERATANVTIERKECGDIEVIAQTSGLMNLELIKISGNSFEGFIKDEYTTLSADGNRPLFIYLQATWEYQLLSDSFNHDTKHYVPAEQIRDIAYHVFHQLETKSIQHLIYHIGLRVLQRFTQLSYIHFESKNMTWDTVIAEIPHHVGKVYTEPKPPYGFQGFTVTRAMLEKSN